MTSASPPARLHLAAFFPFGPEYPWAHADPEIYYDFDSYAKLARTAERGLFSAVFLGDSQRLREHLGKITDTVVTGRPDQLALFAYLSAVTERIGFVATINTTFNDPVELARRLATVEWLSRGRLGWNLVTTDNAWTAENFRRGAYLAHGDRYRQAAEYLEIVRGLWDAWPSEGRRPQRPEFGRSGEFYDITAGPAVPGSIQAQPVLFQAGDSDEGRDFAVAHAEGIFSRYLAFGDAMDFATDLRRRALASGRPADDLKIFPAARIILGANESDAQDKAEWFYRQAWTDRRIRAVLESVWSTDLSEFDVDGPVPAFAPADARQTVTHGVVNTDDRPLATAAKWQALAAERSWSIRELVRHLTDSIVFVGTPGSVADRLAEYVRSGAIDGLNLVANSVPDGYDEVVDLLVPQLQDRGIYPDRYPGTTLRENLGLRTPIAHRRARESHNGNGDAT